MGIIIVPLEIKKIKEEVLFLLTLEMKEGWLVLRWEGEL